MVEYTRPWLVAGVKVCLLLVVGFSVVCPTILAVCAVFPAAAPVAGVVTDTLFWCALAGLCALGLVGVWGFVSVPGNVSAVCSAMRAAVWWVVSERHRVQVQHSAASAAYRKSWEQHGVLVGEGNYYAYTRQEVELRRAWVRGMLAGPFGASVNPLNPRVPMVFDGVVPGGVGRGDDSPTVPLSQK